VTAFLGCDCGVHIITWTRCSGREDVTLQRSQQEAAEERILRYNVESWTSQKGEWATFRRGKQGGGQKKGWLVL